jgi:hypothetical protein
MIMNFADHRTGPKNPCRRNRIYFIINGLGEDITYSEIFKSIYEVYLPLANTSKVSLLQKYEYIVDYTRGFGLLIGFIELF